MQRIRARLGKMEQIKWISHLDYMRAIERSLRRSGLPLVYTQGFNPHPKFAAASALAVGVTSEGECFDFYLERPMRTMDFRRRMSQVLPTGIPIFEAVSVPLTEPALGAIVNAAWYTGCTRRDSDMTEKEVERLVLQVLSSPQLPVKRQCKRGEKAVDIRPLVFDLKAVLEHGDELLLLMWVATGNEGSVRPEEILRVVSDWSSSKICPDFVRLHRNRLLIRNRRGFTDPMQPQGFFREMI